MTTAEDLDNAATEAFAAGKRLPCVGRPEWTSDNPNDRAEAAAACAWCPVFKTCAALAVTNRETWHVWGGYDRGGRGARPEPLGQDVIQNIHGLHQQGISIQRISELLKLKPHQVRWHAEKLRPGPPPRKSKHYGAVLELAKSGLKARAIGRALGISLRQAEYSVTQARKAGDL